MKQSKLPKYWFLALCALNLANYMDRYLVPALLPLIAADYHLNHEQSGMLISSFVLGYVFFSPLFGFFGDKVSRPPLMALGAAIWSLATLASGLGLSFFWFLAARIMVGVGEASFGSISPGYIKDILSDTKKITRAFGWFFLAIPVGAALGYAVGGFVAGASRWHYAFIIGALPGLLLVPYLFRLPESDARILHDQGFDFSLVKKVLSAPLIVYAIAGYIFNAFALNGVAAFITPYGVSIGLGVEEVAQLFGIILVVTGTLGTLAGAWLGSRKDSLALLFNLSALSALLAVPGLISAFYFKSAILLFTGAFFAELFVFLSVAPINTILTVSAPAGTVTLTQALSIFFLNIFGAFTAPILVGFFADRYGLASAMQLNALALVLCALFWRLGAIKAK